MKEKHGEREKRWLFYLNGRAGIYMYLQQKSPHQALQMECLPFVFEKNMAKKNFQILLQYLCNEPLSALKAIVGKIYGKSSLFCNIFSTKNMVKKNF